MTRTEDDFSRALNEAQSDPPKKATGEQLAFAEIYARLKLHESDREYYMDSSTSVWGDYYAFDDDTNYDAMDSAFHATQKKVFNWLLQKMGPVSKSVNKVERELGRRRR